MASSDQSLRQRFRIELWSWSTWLVLCVISYPAAVLIGIAPRAGLLSGLIAGAFLLLAASRGYAGRKEMEAWSWPVFSALAAGVAASALAFGADGASAAAAFVCGLAVAAEIVFIWHFIPWLVHDAEAAEAPPAVSFQLLPLRARSQAPFRAALGLVVFLGLLVLGLGAYWARGEKQVPNPTGWLIALAFLSLALMFVERMSFIARSARDGNLVMPRGCYRKWITAGLLLLAVAAALAAAAPWKPRSEVAGGKTGSASVEAPAPTPLSATGLRETAAAALGALRASIAAVHPLVLALWLLVLILLIAFVLLWGFRRSGAARWLLLLMGWGLSLAARAWRRLLTLLRRLLSSLGPRPAAGTRILREEPADPFFDPFEHPEMLAALSPREVVIRTYHLLLNFADMLGKGRSTGQTPFEYAHFLQQAAPQAAESLKALTWAYAGAMYGGSRAILPEPSAVHQAWQHISKALTAETSPEDLALRRRTYLATRLLEGRR